MNVRLTLAWDDTNPDSGVVHECEMDWPFSVVPREGDLVEFVGQDGDDEDVDLYGVVAGVFWSIPTDDRDPLTVRLRLDEVTEL